MPISNFEEEKEIKKEEEKPFESIRERKKNSDNKKHDFVFKYNDESETDEREEQRFENELKKQDFIKEFLFIRAPVPRSERMIDRLNLKEVTVGKGKLFGPDDYLGLTVLTLFILYVVITRKKQYHTYTFENLQNVNIYNALRPAEINKIYSDKEISPLEQVVLQTNGIYYLLRT